jgi:CubicO group peptidase (beta-lactamase class C family)
MKKTLILLIILCSSELGLFCQLNKTEIIDSILTELTKKDLFSGSVLIAHRSKVLLSKGYGYSDRENKIQNTTETRFDLSSASKIFTGTAVTYLAQQRKIKFTDTIGKYIKGLPKGDIITIHQLLTHSAGFDDYYNAPEFYYSKVKNCTDVMPFMRKLPLVYNPGDSCIYSTGNAIILGALVEKITNKNFQDYIDDTFIKPLKLENTCFVPYWTLNDSQRQYAVGYKSNNTDSYSRNNYDYDYGFIPLSAGGAWSSVNDLYKFDKAVFSARILNKKYLKIMTTRYTKPIWENNHFGYIWIIDDSHTSCIGHAGNSSGWNTWNYYYPESKYTMIILSNLGSVDVFKLSSTFDEILFKSK